MLKNYFKIAWRSLLKSKAYSAINIIGLATGMAIALLIGLWVADELSFDSYHRNHRHLAQVLGNGSYKGEFFTGTYIAMPLGQALRTGFQDEIKKVALISPQDDHILSAGDKKISGSGIWAQMEFPDMMTFRMVKGNADALKDPSTLLLAKSLAVALFGDMDPVNKTIRVDNKLEMRVGGVYEDLPQNTSFNETKMLLPWYNKENSYRNSNTNWMDHNGHLFVQLAETTTAERVTARIKNVPTPFIKQFHEEILLQPLDKLHLYNQFKNGKADGGRIGFVWLFGIIGCFVLLLACINFMNLSTARSEKRAKEVGIRKTLGSLRRQLVGQFLSESILVAFLALGVSFIMVQVSLPFFNHLAGKEMSLPWSSLLFWGLTIGFTLVTGIVSGSYPAFYLSGFEPIRVLKGTARFRTSSGLGATPWAKFFRAGRFAAVPRQALVILQFSVSLTLIIGTIIVFKQIQFAKDRPIGYSREGLVNININTPELEKHYDAIEAELLQSGLISSMAQSSQPVSTFNNMNPMSWRGKSASDLVSFRNVNVTTDFGRTINWRVVQGRDFSRSFATDSNAMVINEAAAKVIGFANPIGEIVTFDDKKWTIIGVVKNFVTNSPFDPIEPAIFLGQGYYTVITMRVRPGLSMHAALAGMEPVFRKYNPGSPFVYQFIDDAFAKKFASEERIGNLATVFAAFAIFISCLGLFGLASFVAEQRTKEIGVRKVLGAGLLSLWGLLSKEFIALVGISLLVSMPLAWYGMQKWLMNYTYRTGMSWWIFAAAGAGILVITLLTVSYQSLKAAMANPVKSLRSE